MKKNSGNGFYLFTAALLLGMLFVNFKFFKGSSGTNIGITDAKVYKINSEKPGLIQHLMVVPGQEIKAGDLLVKMENALLEMDIKKLQTQLGALHKEKTEKATLLESKINYFRAEGGIKEAEFQSEITQISSELNLNRQLTQALATPVTSQPKAVLDNPEELKMAALRDKSKLHQQAMQIKVTEMKKDHAAGILLLENEIDIKQRELDLLLAEKQKLIKYATFGGVIESVFVKPGEQVEAYAPIISINPAHPSSVVAYMVGAKARMLPIGAKVTVAAYDHRELTATGEIIGFGAVAELPDLLQKATAIKAYGREIFIKIPENNPFATGEKVLIK